MEISRTEEIKNRRIALVITLFAFVTLLLFLVFKNIFTSNSSSPLSSQHEMSIGLSNNGDNNKITGKTAAGSTAKSESGSANPKIATDPNAENIHLKSGVEKITEQYKSFTPINTNGQYQKGEPLPPGIPEEKGTSIPEKKGENTSFGFDLVKRTIVNAPKFTNDTKEEGKVIVDIVVNKDGIVTEASPNGRGTTTSSAALKQRARQMALATMFSVNPAMEEQRGTITIVFSFD